MKDKGRFQRWATFLVAGCVVGYTTVDLICGSTELASFLGIALSIIYFCFYERSYRFFNRWNSAIRNSIGKDIMSIQQYVLCPRITIALLGLISLAREVGLAGRVLGIIAIISGIDMIYFIRNLMDAILTQRSQATAIAQLLYADIKARRDPNEDGALLNELYSYIQKLDNAYHNSKGD